MIKLIKLGIKTFLDQGATVFFVAFFLFQVCCPDIIATEISANEYENAFENYIKKSSISHDNNKYEYFNIAPYSTITSNPYCGTLQYLIDGEIPSSKGGEMAQNGPYFEQFETQSNGNITTYACFPVKASKEEIVFTFFDVQKVSAAKFFQRAAFCESFKILGDSTGDGKFDKLILQRFETGKPGWNTAMFKKNTPRLYALKFMVLKAKGRGAPQIAEFQILVPKTPHNKKLHRKLTKTPLLKQNVKELKFTSATPFGDNPKNGKKSDKYQFGAVGSMWMFIDQTKPYEKRGINTFAMNVLKDLSIDRFRMFIGLKPVSMAKITLPMDQKYLSRIYPSDVNKSKRYSGIGSRCMPWPSEVAIGYKDNILKRMSEDFKSNNIALNVIPPRNIPPFDVRPSYYPMAQSDRHGRPDSRFPCVWYGGYWVPAFSQIIKEIVDSNVTSIDVTPDEFYIEGHHLQRMPKNDPCRDKFKEAYGVDTPKVVGDNETYRKWLLFEYDATAKTFKRFVEAAKKANPRIETEANLSIAPLLYYDAPSFSLAIDIIGHRSGIDLLGTDPYFRTDTLGHYQVTKTAVLYQGATPTKNTVMMLQAVCGDLRTPFSNPVWVAGTGTSMIMRGVHNIDLYRLNYFANIGPKQKPNTAYPIYKNWIKMMRALEPLGLKHAKVPKDIAFLYSRAGIDWWELKEKSKKNFKSYPNSAMSGYAHSDAVMKMLFSNGHPFDLYYLDQPETLMNILKYKVVVIPFGYSISKKAYEILRTAQRKGVRILIVNHLGETNEFGTAHPEPLFQEFITLPGVKYMDKDLLVHGNDPQIQSEFLNDLDSLLGEDKSFFVSTYGKDVEVGLLKHENGTLFIPVVNWHNQETIVDLGLKCPKGNYEILRYNLKGVSKCKISGKKKSIRSAIDLRNFRVNLKVHDTMILVVKPKRK